jgi:hypothetical protein
MRRLHLEADRCEDVHLVDRAVLEVNDEPRLCSSFILHRSSFPTWSVKLP